MKSMQFKISILGIKPPVWRRIVVPGKYTFWDLHVAIQDSFGWTDSHLHEFRSAKNYESVIGIPSPDGDDFIEVIPGWKVKLKTKFNEPGQKIMYVYDFGDDWVHEVIFEDYSDEQIKSPLCIGGARACPPEDCGGPMGYEELCKVMKMKKGRRYSELVEWLGGDHDPEQFDIADVHFDDPAERRKMNDMF